MGGKGELSQGILEGPGVFERQKTSLFKEIFLPFGLGSSVPTCLPLTTRLVTCMIL